MQKQKAGAARGGGHSQAASGEQRAVRSEVRRRSVSSFSSLSTSRFVQGAESAGSLRESVVSVRPQKPPNHGGHQSPRARGLDAPRQVSGQVGGNALCTASEEGWLSSREEDVTLGSACRGILPEEYLEETEFDMEAWHRAVGEEPPVTEAAGEGSPENEEPSEPAEVSAGPSTNHFKKSAQLKTELRRRRWCALSQTAMEEDEAQQS